MKAKSFKNGSKSDNRRIVIRIEGDYAEFFYELYYYRHLQWISEQEESGDIEFLDEDAKSNNGFYWIGKDDWNFRIPQWEDHLKMKNWFTDEMFDFLNENLTNFKNGKD